MNPSKTTKFITKGLIDVKYGFVVEGFNDETKVLSVMPTAHVVVTKGTRFDNRVKMDVNLALDSCDELFLIG